MPSSTRRRKNWSGNTTNSYNEKFTAGSVKYEKHFSIRCFHSINMGKAYSRVFGFGFLDNEEPLKTNCCVNCPISPRKKHNNSCHYKAMKYSTMDKESNPLKNSCKNLRRNRCQLHLQTPKQEIKPCYF